MNGWTELRPAGLGPREPYLPSLQRLSGLLLTLSMLAYFCLSSHALFVLGIPYDVPLGSFPAKIHPGTYLLLLAWFTALAARGNPLRTLGRQALQQPALAGATACMLLVFAWAVIRHGPSGLAFLLDSLVAACLAAMTAALQPRYWQRQLLQLLMLLLVLNALLALAEFAVGRRLVPLFPLAERQQEAFFRSSALLGHPLANALVVMALLPALLLMPWRPAVRAAAVLVVVLGLFTFGSRSSLAGLLVYAALAMLPLAWRAAHGGYDYRHLTGGLVGLVAGAAAVVGLVAATGVGERIFRNLTWDNSAAVRLRSWDVLDHVGGSDLWFGIPVPRIDAIAHRVGIDLRYEAIENFWLYLLLLLGVVGFSLFLLGLALLMRHLWRLAQPPLRVALVVYLVLASGSNTLASKTVSLLLLALAVQCASAVRPATPAYPRSGLPPARRHQRPPIQGARP